MRRGNEPLLEFSLLCWRVLHIVSRWFQWQDCVLTSEEGKMADETLTGSSPASLACEYDFSSKLVTVLSMVAIIAVAFSWNVFDIGANGCWIAWME